MRRQINESLWTGIAMKSDGLVSLKDILKSKEEHGPDEFVMLSNIVDDEDESDLRDKDHHLIVSRTKIDFNKKDCELITITDISIFQKLKI